MRGDVSLEFGEEDGKVGSKGGFLFLQDSDGGGEIDGPFEAGGDASEGTDDAGMVTIGAKPVGRAEVVEPGKEDGRKYSMEGIERPVEGANEGRERFGAIARPVARQEVIEEQVEEYTAKAPVRRLDTLESSADDGMTIGETIDALVLGDAGLEGGGERGEITGGGHEVGEKITDAVSGIGRGKIEVGEPVQNGGPNGLGRLNARELPPPPTARTLKE